MTLSVRLPLFFSLTACLLVGCPTPPPSSSGTGGASGGSGSIEAQRCADSLRNAFNSLDPHRLEIDADIEATANEMNNWLSSCGQSEWDDKKALKQLDKILSDEQMAAIQAERFGRRDVAHVLRHLHRRMQQLVSQRLLPLAENRGRISGDAARSNEIA